MIDLNQKNDKLPTAAYLCFDDGTAEVNPHIQVEDLWGELIRRKDIEKLIKDKIREASVNEANPSRTKLIEEQHKNHILNELLEEVQNED